MEREKEDSLASIHLFRGLLVTELGAWVDLGVNPVICTGSSDSNTHAKSANSEKKCCKCGPSPLTGELRTDRVNSDEVSTAPGVLARSLSRNMDRTPSAETHVWFLRVKGIFAGASDVHSRPNRSAWEPGFSRNGPQSQRRIGGNVSTVEKEKREHCY